MRKIILGLMIFLATTVMGASEKVYKAGEYDVKNEIFYEKGTNMKLNGIVKIYHPSGALHVEFNIKDGKANGIAKSYYETGALKSENNFKDGKLNGITKSYYESGALNSENNFKDDKPNGIQKTYNQFGVLIDESYIKDDITGNIVKTYYKSGALKLELNIKDGLPNGIQKVYNESGALLGEVNYKAGEAISGKFYKEDGKIDTKMTSEELTKFLIFFAKKHGFEKIYKAGDGELKDGVWYEKGTNIKLNGILKLFYTFGDLKFASEYKDGKLNGISKEYAKSGALEWEWYYKDGKLNGISKAYYESGALSGDVNFINGKAISGKFYKEDGKIDRNMTNEDFARNGFNY